MRPLKPGDKIWMLQGVQEYATVIRIDGYQVWILRESNGFQTWLNKDDTHRYRSEAPPLVIEEDPW